MLTTALSAQLKNWVERCVELLHSLSLCVRESSAISVITRLIGGLVKIRTSNPVQSLVEQFNATPIRVLSRVFEKEKLPPSP